MTDLEALLAASGVLALGAITPGPSLAVVIRNSVQGGRAQGLLCALGHGLGFGAYALAAIFGMTALMQTYPAWFTALQWAGVALLLWLAWQTLRPPAAAGSGSHHPPIGGFAEGFLIAFLNPKIALFFVAVLSAVLQPDMHPRTPYLIAALGWTIDTGWYALTAVVLSTGAATRWFQRHGRWVERMMALGLLGLALATMTRLLSP